MKRKTRTVNVNRGAIVLALGLGLLSGCAQRYKITLNYGQAIIAASKPRLEHGYYHYKDSAGREMVVPEGRVREIAPVSMAKQEGPALKQAPVK